MFTAREVSNILESSKYLPRPDARITSVSMDSRQIADGSEVCFVALKGLRSDGHQFLSQVWQAGVRNFVVDTSVALPDLPESNVYPAENTVHALQAIARAHRSQFTLPCIGITGSNGKTWVKEWLYQLLSPDHFVVKSPRSYNSQIGVPLSVLQIKKEHTLGIFEAGISTRGEMSRLADVIRPEIGIFTHLGDAHQAGFETSEEKLIEKLQLFKGAKTILCCGEEPWIVDQIRKTYPQAQVLSWSSNNAKGELTISRIDIDDGATTIYYVWNGSQESYTIRFTDQASVRNSITCCLTMLQYGLAADLIEARMAGLHPIAMRLAIHHLPGNSVLINDSYSLDMGSLSIALESLRQHSSGMSRTVILSDIDKQHAGSYQAIADLFGQHEVNHVLAIGQDIGELKSLLGPQVTFKVFADMQTFVAQKPWQALLPGAFLLKGARLTQITSPGRRTPMSEAIVRSLVASVADHGAAQRALSRGSG
jgi:alanine racemase